MYEQYHLNYKRGSKRVVRVEALDDVTVAENLTNAAKTLTEDATVLTLRKAEYRLGVQCMIREISDPTDNEMDPNLKFKKVTILDFQDGLGTFFTAKDVQFLEALYREIHEITKTELDVIMGKGKDVAGGASR